VEDAVVSRAEVLQLSLGRCLAGLVLALVAGCSSSTTAPAPEHVIRVPADHPTIQAALDACADGDTVLVAAGTYTGPANRVLDFAGKSLVLMGAGRSGDVVIDCGGENCGFHFHSGEDSSSVVIGINVINGAGWDYGGAVLCEGASPRFVECSFSYCMAGFSQGGAIACVGGSPTFVSCVIDTNGPGRTGGGGAGAYLVDSQARFVECVFSRNAHPDEAGAVQCDESAAVFESCIFWRNMACNGAAVSCHNSPAQFSRCTFVSNRGYNRGGAVWCDGPEAPSFVECTFVHNHAANGSALCCECEDASPSVLNTVMAFGSSRPVVCWGTGAPDITHCVVFGNAASDSLCGSHHDNLFCNPRLCDVAQPALGVAFDSPCLAQNNAWAEQVGAYTGGCSACVRSPGQGDAPVALGALPN